MLRMRQKSLYVRPFSQINLQFAVAAEKQKRAISYVAAVEMKQIFELNLVTQVYSTIC